MSRVAFATYKCWPVVSPEECESEGGLASSSPPNDPDLLPALCLEVDAPEHEIEAVPVPRLVVGELDDAVLGPVLARVVLGHIEGGLLHDLLVLPDPLHGHHVGLHLRGLSDQHVEDACDVEGVAEGQTDIAGVDGAATEDGEEGSEHEDHVADDLESYGEPPGGDVSRVVADLVGVDPRLVLVDEVLRPREGPDGGGPADALAEVSVDGRPII